MKIVVPDLVSNSYFPAVAAVELGFFAERGLDARLEHVYPVTKCLELLRAGEVDFVAGTAHAVPQVFPGYDGAKLLAALAQRMYWLLVVRRDLNAKRGDLAALKGLRVGAAPMVEQGLRGLLAAAGLDVARDKIEIMPVPGAAGVGVSFGVQAARALEEGLIDAFWANGVGAECAVRSGAGSVLLDVRRGDSPAAARSFTFPALVTADRLIEKDPDMVAAAIGAVVAVQNELKARPERARDVARKLFPPAETEMIEDVLRRDLPYYDASIPREVAAAVNRFVAGLGVVGADVPYERCVATQFTALWKA